MKSESKMPTVEQQLATLQELVEMQKAERDGNILEAIESLKDEMSIPNVRLLLFQLFTDAYKEGKEDQLELMAVFHVFNVA